MEYVILIFLHILGATIWAGGHLILSIAILPGALKERNVEAVKQFETKFEKLGIPALVVQILTGIRLAQLFKPEMSTWFSFEERISAHIALKFILLGLTLVLAVHARLKLVPNLEERNLKLLAFHIIAVTVIATLFVFVGVSMRVGGLF